jgi:hypothetical protein
MMLAMFPTVGVDLDVSIMDDGHVALSQGDASDTLIVLSPETTRCLAAVLVQAANVASGIRSGRKPKP